MTTAQGLEPRNITGVAMVLLMRLKTSPKLVMPMPHLTRAAVVKMTMAQNIGDSESVTNCGTESGMGIAICFIRKLSALGTISATSSATNRPELPR